MACMGQESKKDCTYVYAWFTLCTPETNTNTTINQLYTTKNLFKNLQEKQKYWRPKPRQNSTKSLPQGLMQQKEQKGRGGALGEGSEWRREKEGGREEKAYFEPR